MLTVTPIDGGYHLGAISDTTQIDCDRDINCVGHSGVQSAWCMVHGAWDHLLLFGAFGGTRICGVPAHGCRGILSIPVLTTKSRSLFPIEFAAKCK